VLTGISIGRVSAHWCILKTRQTEYACKSIWATYADIQFRGIYALRAPGTHLCNMHLRKSMHAARNVRRCALAHSANYVETSTICIRKTRAFNCRLHRNRRVSSSNTTRLNIASTWRLRRNLTSDESSNAGGNMFAKRNSASGIPRNPLKMDGTRRRSRECPSPRPLAPRASRSRALRERSDIAMEKNARSRDRVGTYPYRVTNERARARLTRGERVIIANSDRTGGLSL